MNYRVVYRRSRYFLGRWTYVPQRKVFGFIWMDWCGDSEDGFDTMEGAKTAIDHYADNSEKVVYP